MAALALLLVNRVAAEEVGTAYEALRVVSGQLGRAALNHVISVSGDNGTPQPETWRVLLEDRNAPAGVREVVVTNGQIAADHPSSRQVVGSSEGATIKTSHLNLDSSGAYAVAFHTADKSGTQFSTVNYTLRTDERGEPIWVVTLKAQDRVPVGTVFIGANKGNVARTEGMFGAPVLPDVPTNDRVADQEPPPDEEGDGESHGPLYHTKAKIRQTFQRAQDEARGMFDRVRRSFEDFINRT